MKTGNNNHQPRDLYALKLIFKDFRERGYSQKAACQKTGISEKTGVVWKKELGLNDAEIKEKFNNAAKLDRLESVSEVVAKCRVRFPKEYPGLLHLITEIHKPI